MPFSRAVAAGLFATTLLAGTAHAAVIAGPTLGTIGATYLTGLEFKALTGATLTSFVFQNRGKADTIELIDYSAAAGTYTVANYVVTVAGNPHQTLTVNWALTAGETYYLFQTTRANAYFTSYGGALPANGDIAILQSGVFGRGLGPALTTGGTGAAFWAAFNNITTGAPQALRLGAAPSNVSAVPEPTGWAMLICGFGVAGGALRRRRRAASASRDVAADN